MIYVKIMNRNREDDLNIEESTRLVIPFQMNTGWQIIILNEF